jgi:hypothetical protein
MWFFQTMTRMMTTFGVGSFGFVVNIVPSYVESSKLRDVNVHFFLKHRLVFATRECA